MKEPARYMDGPGPDLERQAKLFVLLYSAPEVEARNGRIYECSAGAVAAGSRRELPADRHRRPGAALRLVRPRVLPGPAGRDAAWKTRHTRSRFDCLGGWSAPRARPSGRFRACSGTASRCAKVEYEITISATLLFNTFQDVDRPVTVGGLVCRDRVEALQRIFEHELLHLAEFLAWGRSNCRAENFHRLSRRIFAHEGAFHDLITPREQARAAYDIRIGDHVSF